MASSETVVGALVGVTVGVVAAVITHRALTEGEKLAIVEELEDQKRRAYRDGWDDASKHPNNIRQAYEKLFGTPDETKGTALQSHK